jgi:hypothetical protein
MSGRVVASLGATRAEFCTGAAYKSPATRSARESQLTSSGKQMPGAAWEPVDTSQSKGGWLTKCLISLSSVCSRRTSTSSYGPAQCFGRCLLHPGFCPCTCGCRPHLWPDPGSEEGAAVGQQEGGGLTHQGAGGWMGEGRVLQMAT